MLNKIKNFIKSRWGIVPEWRCWWKWISNQLTIIGTALLAFADQLQGLLLNLVANFDQLPHVMQTAFSDGWIRGIGFALLVLSIPARVTIQKRLPQGPFRH